jgi:DNA-binding CsgD family transcriptional regulator
MVTMSSSKTMQVSSQPAAGPPTAPPPPPEFALLQVVLEGFTDGVLIVNQKGRCLHHNQAGRAICQLLAGQCASHGAMPTCLKVMCHHLLESRTLFPDQLLVLTQTLHSPTGHVIRAKVQWLTLQPTQEPYLLVLLEDEVHSAQTTALLEAVQYHLTPREQDVWLLRRAHHSYEEIAAKLFIAVNTVKRHLKSIHAKRRSVLDKMTNAGD